MTWRTIDSAPRDGFAFLAYGTHTTNNRGHWQVGDRWWAILIYDVWREVGMGGGEFVFAKDGAPPWSKPTHWQPLLPPSEGAAS